MKYLLIYLLSFIFLSLAFVTDVVAQTAESQYEMVVQLMDNEDYQTAIIKIDSILLLDASDARIWNMKGNCNSSLGNVSESIAAYKKCIEVDSSYVNAYYNLANVYEADEQLSKANEYFRQYIEMNPSDSDGYLRVGQNYRIQGDLVAAFSFYDQAYAVDSSNVSLIFYLVKEYYFSFNNKKVVELSKQGLRIDSSFLDFHILPGFVAMQEGRYEDAIGHSEKALQIEALNVDALQLGFKAKIYKETDSEQLIANQNEQFKFKNINCRRYQELRTEGKSYDFKTLQTTLLSGDIMSLDDYFRFYFSQHYQDSYSPYGATNEQVREYFDKEDMESLAAMSQEVLNNNPIIISDLYRVALANYYTDNVEEFTRLYSIYYGLMEAILATGTGRDYDSAFIVLSTTDEYSVLNYLDKYSVGQALQPNAGHSYDVLTSVDRAGAESEVFFIIDILFENLRSTVKLKQSNDLDGK